jgi:hypothetical protein
MISNVVVDIAFPAFAKIQHARDRLIAQLVSFTRLNLITVMTYSAVVFVAAEDVVAALFPAYAVSPPGEPWIAPATDAVRLMAAVTILRSIALMIPPLLDGMGYPNRTFVYTLTASITLPLSFIAGAHLFGDSMGYLSVAVAWAIGYPIAFLVLIWLAAYTLSWSVWAYLRAIGGVALCMIAAALVGLGPHHLITGIPAGVRLLITSGVVVLVTGALLAYTQGLSLRTAVRALKGDPKADLSSAALEAAAIAEAAKDPTDPGSP